MVKGLTKAADMVRQSMPSRPCNNLQYGRDLAFEGFGPNREKTALVHVHGGAHP